jgi:hypothetical protein
MLDLESVCGKDELTAAMEGRVIGYGALTDWHTRVRQVEEPLRNAVVLLRQPSPFLSSRRPKPCANTAGPSEPQVRRKGH